MSNTAQITCWAMRHWHGFLYPFSVRRTRKECVAAWEEQTGRAEPSYGRWAPNRPVKVIVSQVEE